MDIKNLLEMATQARLDAEESKVKLEQDEAHNMSLSFIIRQLPYWRRYYLKKNQPENYFRITQIIHPDMLDYPQTCWNPRPDNPDFFVFKNPNNESTKQN